MFQDAMRVSAILSSTPRQPSWRSGSRRQGESSRYGDGWTAASARRGISGARVAALAMIELDGIARRLVICPPDVPQDYLRATTAELSRHLVAVGDFVRVYENAAGTVHRHHWPKRVILAS
jgi:hypothetical protein